VADFFASGFALSETNDFSRSMKFYSDSTSGYSTSIYFGAFLSSTTPLAPPFGFSFFGSALLLVFWLITPS